MSWVTFGGGIKSSERLAITFESVTATIKALAAGTRARKVTVVVDEAFDGDMAVSIGFPADHSAIMATTQIDLQNAGVYSAEVYRTSAVAETLRAYFSGTATQGSGSIVVEFF